MIKAQEYSIKILLFCTVCMYVVEKWKSSIPSFNLYLSLAPQAIEWVLYHMLLGVEHFYIFDQRPAKSVNMWNEAMRPLLDANVVTVVPYHYVWDGFVQTTIFQVRVHYILTSLACMHSYINTYIHINISIYPNRTIPPDINEAAISIINTNIYVYT
jgi:hypothetical protein